MAERAGNDAVVIVLMEQSMIVIPDMYGQIQLTAPQGPLASP